MGEVESVFSAAASLSLEKLFSEMPPQTWMSPWKSRNVLNTGLFLTCWTTRGQTEVGRRRLCV